MVDADGDAVGHHYLTAKVCILIKFCFLFSFAFLTHNQIIDRMYLDKYILSLITEACLLCLTKNYKKKKNDVYYKFIDFRLH